MQHPTTRNRGGNHRNRTHMGCLRHSRIVHNTQRDIKPITTHAINAECGLISQVCTVYVKQRSPKANSLIAQDSMGTFQKKCDRVPKMTPPPRKKAFGDSHAWPLVVVRLLRFVLTSKFFKFYLRIRYVNYTFTAN